MPDDLPIYSDSVLLRSGIQFADLLRWKGIDASPIWKKSDTFIAQMEGGKDIEAARTAVLEPDKSGLIRAHAIIFSGSPGAGELRKSRIAGRYRGQDCPEPEFINQSLDNFFNWMTAESVAEIHPIEKAALVLTRIVDIWPFDSGNLTMAIVLANAFLRQAGMPVTAGITAPELRPPRSPPSASGPTHRRWHVGMSGNYLGNYLGNPVASGRVLPS